LGGGRFLRTNTTTLQSFGEETAAEDGVRALGLGVKTGNGVSTTKAGRTDREFALESVTRKAGAHRRNSGGRRLGEESYPTIFTGDQTKVRARHGWVRRRPWTEMEIQKLRRGGVVRLGVKERSGEKNGPCQDQQPGLNGQGGDRLRRTGEGGKNAVLADRQGYIFL